MENLRPIKLLTDSEAERTKLLAEAKNLRAVKKGGWKKVYVNPDLTPKERDLRKELLKTLKERQEKGEKNLIIVKGRITE